MAILQVTKKTALPSSGSRTAHTIYLIAPPSKPDFVEMYVTGSTGASIRRMIDEARVQEMIDAVSTGNEIFVVDDITARDALSPAQNIKAYVVDASDDATVTSGGATYVYDFANTTWIKTSEDESLDFVFNWANLQDKPTSAVANIDEAVSFRHEHSNKTQLDKIDEDGDGNLTYDGELPKTAWVDTEW